jgi:hypothetical protein
MTITTRLFGKSGPPITQVGLGGEGVLRTHGREAEAKAVIEEAAGCRPGHNLLRPGPGLRRQPGLLWQFLARPPGAALRHLPDQQVRRPRLPERQDRSGRVPGDHGPGSPGPVADSRSKNPPGYRGDGGAGRSLAGIRGSQRRRTGALPGRHRSPRPKNPGACCEKLAGRCCAHARQSSGSRDERISGQ